MTNFWIALGLTAVSGYLLGSINSAIIVSRLWQHDDIRKHGSGNAGATNMLRTFGKTAAALTTAGDILKAVLAVLLARAIFNLFTVTLAFDPGYIAGLFVLVGHIFPAYFRFKGGKGVMPALGIVLIVNPLAFAVMLVIALPILLIFRIVSLVSVLSAILLPIVTFVLGRLRHADPLAETLLTLSFSILVLYSHRENIKRLLSGTEKPIVPRSRK